MDSFRRGLSYSLLLLIVLGFIFSQPIDHGWGFAAKHRPAGELHRNSAERGGMGALSVVELNPLADADLCL